jgi:thioester reductase-like protein
MQRNVLITGATGFIGKRLLKLLLDGNDNVFVLARKKSLKKLPERSRVKIVPGDIRNPDVVENKKLLEEIKNEVTDIYHLAAIYDLGVDKETAREVNVNGTKNVLKLARSVKNLNCFNHVSTIAVSGDFSGTYYEYNFDEGQKFTNWYAWSKFESERHVRNNFGYIPVRIFRPGAVIGDSGTGEMDKIDGPYYIILLLTLGIHFITPLSDENTVPLVPVDFVVNAINYLSRKPDTINKTFCLSDPKPPTYSDFIDVVCEKLETFKPIRKMNLKPILPVLEYPMKSKIVKAISRLINIPVEGLSYAFLDTHYDTKNTTKFLLGSGIKCPEFSNYADKIVGYFVNHLIVTKPFANWVWKRSKNLRTLLRKVID